MKILNIALSLFSLVFIAACPEKDEPYDSNDEWLIDQNFIRQGCYAGQDCIPSLQSPNKSPVGGDNISFLDDDDRVVGIWNGSQYVAYPHPILDWHEIVNETGYTISYCPLTGSAIHMDTELEFGVSGLLYNSNLIMYDRGTSSYWPQLFLKSAAGDHQGSHVALKPLIETSWANWKNLFPETRVINSNTGHGRNYNLYPYGSYQTCNSNSCSDYLYFPVDNIDGRLPAKDRVLGIVYDGEQKAYPLEHFPNPVVLADTVDQHQISVVISGEDDIAIAFETTKTIAIHTWMPDAGTIILADEHENQYNILGLGTNTAENLKAAPGFIAYWFALAAFYPEVEIE